MLVSKIDNIYKVIRITSSQNGILGVWFGEKDQSENHIEIIPKIWLKLSLDHQRKILSSEEKVLEEVLSDLTYLNEYLKTNYDLSKIYFSPFESHNNLS